MVKLFFRITLSSIEIFRAETWTKEEKQSKDFMNWKSKTKVVATGLNSGYLCHSVETQIIHNLMKVYFWSIFYILFSSQVS